MDLAQWCYKWMGLDLVWIGWYKMQNEIEESGAVWNMVGFLQLRRCKGPGANDCCLFARWLPFVCFCCQPEYIHTFPLKSNYVSATNLFFTWKRLTRHLRLLFSIDHKYIIIINYPISSSSAKSSASQPPSLNIDHWSLSLIIDHYHHNHHNDHYDQGGRPGFTAPSPTLNKRQWVNEYNFENTHHHHPTAIIYNSSVKLCCLILIFGVSNFDIWQD